MLTNCTEQNKVGQGGYSGTTCRDKKGMTNMDRVVNTEANCKDNVDARDDVDCDAPEMKESNNIC